MLSFIIAFVFLVVGSVADYDCSQQPNFQGSPPCCKSLLVEMEIKTKCLKLFPTDILCNIECIFNEIGAFRNGQLEKQDVLSDVIADYYKSNPETAAVAKQALSKCFKSVSVNEAKVLKIHKGNCRPTAMAIASCVETTVFVECPPSMRTESEKCDKVREFVKACTIYSDIM